MTLLPDKVTFRGTGGIHNSTPSYGFKIWFINNINNLKKIPLPLLDLICPMFAPVPDVITVSYIYISNLF